MLTYEEWENKIEKVLEHADVAFLATSGTDGVHSRAMCLVNDGLKIYMQTDKTFRKVDEIRKNEKVAISFGSYNFDGKAKILGAPKDYKFFVEKFKAKHLKSYEQYTNLPNEVLIEIELTECRIWSKSMIVVNFLDKTVKEIAYDEM